MLAGPRPVNGTGNGLVSGGLDLKLEDFRRYHGFLRWLYGAKLKGEHLGGFSRDLREVRGIV